MSVLMSSGARVRFAPGKMKELMEKGLLKQNENGTFEFSKRSKEDKLELTDDDSYAINIAIKTARHFLKHPQIKPLQVVGLGNALYALERMPLTTLGTGCEFGINYHTGTEEFSETRYICFLIYESGFQIFVGKEVYDSSLGSDTISEPGYLIDIDGNRETECDLINLENSIAEYLNLGAKITVHDESDIEYEDSDKE